MRNYNPEITKYIENVAEFEQPILNRLRDIVHTTCPEVKETMKWSKPHFDYKTKPMCFMDALKERVAFGFWYDSLIFDSPELSEEAKRIKGPMGFMKTIDDIPDEKLLVECIKLAMKNIDEGKKVEKVVKPKRELVIPDYVIKALSSNKKALENFEKMSPSHKREYVDWIVDAKTEATREKRMAQMVEWLVEGKSRHWKYA